jgi:hypothetical protein
MISQPVTDKWIPFAGNIISNGSFHCVLMASDGVVKVNKNDLKLIGNKPFLRLNCTVEFREITRNAEKEV